jgi:hypothetical protein
MLGMTARSRPRSSDFDPAKGSRSGEKPPGQFRAVVPDFNASGGVARPDALDHAVLENVGFVFSGAVEMRISACRGLAESLAKVARLMSACRS